MKKAHIHTRVRRGLERKRWRRSYDYKLWRLRRRRACDPAFGVLRLAAPAHWHITTSKSDARSSVLAFIRKIRRAVLVERKSVLLDFRFIEKVFSCGTLLFLAEIDNLIRLRAPNVKIECVFPRDKIVEQVFQQVGIFRLLGRCSRIPPGEFDKTVRHWHFATGVQIDATELGDMMDRFEGMFTPALSRSIYKGITEAMTNSVHHAYQEARVCGGVPSEPRWWVFSQELDGELTVVFCDLGIGIPRSLPSSVGSQPGWLVQLNDYMTKMSATLGRGREEAKLIKAAIEIGRTRTQLKHRGKGLRQVVDAVSQGGTGTEVVIHSNAGCYILTPSAIIREKLVQFEDSIMGTLIAWRVPLEQEK